MNKIKKITALFFVLIFSFSLCMSAFALDIKETKLELNGKSAILMDATTGTVLYESNADERLSPASVTKIMTLLLVFEALQDGRLKWDDVLVVSENAASMGGSQVFLEPGEKMSVEDLIKSVVIASANDAAVTLAEHVAGSEEAFIEAMNKRAAELGMLNTKFENATGLDDDTVDHKTTARDIAIMSKELLKHEKITEYTTIWMDTIRNGEFGLTNTNRLVRFYRGITGLKTGFTSGAGYCISASAKRDNTHLIAVIMGAESADLRNVSVSKLLDFGFANYSLYTENTTVTGAIKVYGGKSDSVQTTYDTFNALINKSNSGKIETKIELDEYIQAPVSKGDVVGKIIYSVNGEIIGEAPVFCAESVEKISFIDYAFRILKKFLLK